MKYLLIKLGLISKTRIRSIQRFLIIWIISILTLSSAVLGYFNYSEILQFNHDMFQTQLISSAELLDAVTSVKIQDVQAKELAKLLKESSRATISELSGSAHHKALTYYIRYQNMLSFQVWNTRTGALVVRSDNAPELPMSHVQFGFSKETLVIGEPDWEAFTLTNTQNETRIIIAARADLHASVAEELIIDDLILLFFIYTLLSMSVLIVIHFSLKHLKGITRQLSTRDPSYLQPIDLEGAPSEIRPLVEELNHLFQRVDNVLQREKRFTANAAHELRTPLSALKTHAEVADRAQNKEELDTAVSKLIKGADRCTHLVAQLMTLSRLEPQDKLTSITTLNLNDNVVEMLSDITPYALDKEIELTFLPADVPAIVSANEAALSILVRNLIDNAIRYTPEKGSIDVTLTVENKKVVFTVIDSGPGVHEDELGKIFDRFYRELGNRQEGSGLGLSIVQHITRLHNGSINAKNRTDRTGLVMTLSLPSVDGT